MTGLRRISLAAALVALGACIPGEDVTRAGVTRLFPGPAPQLAAFAKGAVRVRGPDGFCVDPRTVRETDAGGFVMLGSCASIANSERVAAPRRPAILTVAVSAPARLSVAGSTEQLSQFLQTEAGQALLARDGSAGSVTVEEVISGDGIVLVRSRDEGWIATSRVERSYWRGFFDLGSRVVTVSVFGLTHAPLKSAQGQRLLLDFVKSIRAANGAG